VQPGISLQVRTDFGLSNVLTVPPDNFQKAEGGSVASELYNRVDLELFQSALQRAVVAKCQQGGKQRTQDSNISEHPMLQALYTLEATVLGTSELKTQVARQPLKDIQEIVLFFPIANKVLLNIVQALRYDGEWCLLSW
jgi:hypothetical protein